MLGMARHIIIAVSSVSAFAAALPGKPTLHEVSRVSFHSPASTRDMGDCLAQAGETRAAEYRSMCADIASVVEAPSSVDRNPYRMTEAKSPPWPLAKPERPAPVRVRRAEGVNLARPTSMNGKSPVSQACTIGENALGSSAGKLIPVQGGCRVASPRSGTVVFAGFFRGYRGLVILDIGQGRHLIVGGLGEISVKPHQIVNRGHSLGLSSRDVALDPRDEKGAATGTIFIRYRNSATSRISDADRPRRMAQR